jgi:hypothetical protein
MFGRVVNRRGELTSHGLSGPRGGASVTDMSPGVSQLLLRALIDDFSSVSRLSGRSGVARPGRSRAAAPVLSPAVGRRVIEVEAWSDGAGEALVRQAGGSVLIHGTATGAFTAWRAAARTAVGIDVAQERDRRCVESVHRSLALLTEVPRTVPVTVGLVLGPGWRDALDLVLARGRSVRFSVCGVDAPDAPALVDAIRTVAAERCEFSWSCGPWHAVTDPLAGPLPGILNVLLATAAALRGADYRTVGEELARTDTVDVVDAVSELGDGMAREVRALLSGFAVREVGQVVDSLSDLDLLPKAACQERPGALV